MKNYRNLSSSIVMIIIIMAAFAVSPATAQQRDSDGDGLPDSDDNCPNEAGPRSNNGCPFVIVIPSVDTDGDGLPDSDDQCPTVAGLRENQGCPASSPDPNDPPPSSSDPNPVDTDGDGIDDGNDACVNEPGTASNNGCPEPPEPAIPPFQPPLLSNDACFATASGDYNARVRDEALLQADHIGNLLPGVIYPATGLVNTAEGQWVKLATEFQHFDLEATIGLPGYVFGDVVNHSNCPTIGNDSVEIHIPIDGLACTVTTVFNWEFAFNAAEGEIIPVGTVAQAILSGDFDNYGDVSQWVAETRDLNGNTVEYMTYGTIGESNYLSFPRTGGTCGRIGDSNARRLVFPLPPAEGRDDTDFPGANGELDLFLVNIPGGGFPPPEFPWQVGWAMIGGNNSNDDGSDTVEICYYAELYEVGVYNEVCVEIEIPDGCILIHPEAGVYIIECEEGTVEVNPLFGDAAMLDLSGGRENILPIGVQLQYIFNQPAAEDDELETVEYCVYLEAHEVGVFEEVCYEIEIPEGCTLISHEVGVYTIDCPEVFDGDVADVFQNPSLPSIPHSDGDTQTVEYCIYVEVHEVGVFEEVCYEIEIPEGCTLLSEEAGVYTVDCPEVYDGDVADNFQPAQRDPLANAEVDTMDSILGDICVGDYIIWWDEDDNGEPIPGSVDGGCMEWL